MTIVRMLSYWLAVAALVGLFSVVLVRGVQTESVESVMAYRVGDTLRVQLPVGAGDLRLRLWVVTPGACSLDSRQSLMVRLDLETADLAGEAVWSSAQHVVFRQGVLLAGERILPASEVANDACVWNRRDIRLTIQEQLSGGVLSITPSSAEGAEMLALASWRDDLGSLHPLSALPPPGLKLAPIREIRVLGAPVPRSLTAAASAPVAPGGALAFNLLDASSFVARWVDAKGRPVDVPTQVRIIGREQSPATSDLGLRSEIRLEGLPEGVVSVQVALGPSAKQRAWLRVDVDPSVLWGEPALLPSTDRLWIGPEFRTLDAYRVGPEHPPLRFSVDDTRWARLTVRSPQAGSTRAGLAARAGPRVGLEMVALGEAGAQLDRWAWNVRANVSPFERYTLGDSGLDVAVSEPTTSHFSLPSGTRELQITSTQVADLSLAVPGSDKSVLDGRYSLDADSPLRRRYAPQIERRWQPRGPLEHEELGAAGRVIRIDGQARIEPWTFDADKGPSRQSLQLPGPYELLAERASEGHSGNRAPLSKRARRVRVPSSGRLELDYRAPSRAIGAQRSVWIDGQPRAITLASAGGVLRLDGLKQGYVAVSTDIGGRVLARAPGGWWMRRVWRLAPGQSINVPAPPGKGSLSVHAYRRGRAVKVPLEFEVHQQDARGPFESLTARSGTLWLETVRGQATVMSSSAGQADALSAGVIYLRDDAGESGRSITLTSRAAEPLYVRLMSTWATRTHRATMTTLRGGGDGEAR